MKYKNLENALRKKYKERLEEAYKNIESEDGLRFAMLHTLNKRTPYKGDRQEQKTKTKNALFRYYEKQLNQELEQLKRVEEVDSFGGRLVITLRWTKSRTWGYTLKSETNYGFESPTVSGCGYCKRSTGTAYSLNDHLPLLKLLYAKEEERLNEIRKAQILNHSKEHQEKYLCRRAFIGYGSGYGILPQFEGGVGTSSHERICETLGLKMESVNEDVFIVEVSE